MAMRISVPRVQSPKALLTAQTLAASSGVYIRCDAGITNPSKCVDWLVKANKASTINGFRSISNALTATLTLASGTRVDDGDTFVLNGVTLTAETTPVDATGLKWLAGLATATLDAASLATCINTNVPGIQAVAAAEVITLTPVAHHNWPKGAPCILFGQGTSDANEIAFADNTLANLMVDASFTQITGADNSTKLGTLYRQTIDGFPFVYIYYLDTSAAATTLSVSTLLHDNV